MYSSTWSPLQYQSEPENNLEQYKSEPFRPVYTDQSDILLDSNHQNMDKQEKRKSNRYVEYERLCHQYKFDLVNTKSSYYKSVMKHFIVPFIPKSKEVFYYPFYFTFLFKDKNQVICPLLLVKKNK